MKHKISFIGAGTMGYGMVTQLVQAGFDVQFYNRTLKEIEGAASVNLEDLSGDIIFICVSNDNAVKECFEKVNFKEGQIFVDCGTTSLQLTKELQAMCNEKGCSFLDAPITGSKLGAESGNLTFMVGGKKEVFDMLEEEFAVMGKIAVYCGEATYGQKMKHALNLTQSNILQGYLEGIILCLKLGVPLEATISVMENSGAKNGVGSFKTPYIQQRDFAPHFLLNLMYKDLKLAESEINDLGLDLPISKKTISVFQEAMDKGLGKEDFVAIVKLLEEKNKVTLQ
jgi:3-hydroxyisobutyrate dehydrogenase-like beta-hydroxyacid dehydrogenase